jgi:hypothetical protein
MVAKIATGEIEEGQTEHYQALGALVWEPIQFIDFDHDICA